MAVTMDRIPNRLWQCLSTDTKPNLTSGPQGVLVGDALYQTDTQSWFVYTPNGWSASTNAAPLRTY
jgi:hypothetical protein